MTWKLVDENTKEPIKIGSRRTTFRGVEVFLRGVTPPHNSGSGRVLVEDVNIGNQSEYFPSVIGAKFIEVK